MNRHRAKHGHYSSTRVPQKFSNFSAQHGGRTSQGRRPQNSNTHRGLILLFSPTNPFSPSFIYPAASESIVAVSICPVILAVYHDYTGGRTGSIHRHRPSAIQVHVSGAQSFMHAVSKAVVHSTLSLSPPPPLSPLLS